MRLALAFVYSEVGVTIISPIYGFTLNYVPNYLFTNSAKEPKFQREYNGLIQRLLTDKHSEQKEH